jgi:hypothetical protein
VYKDGEQIAEGTMSEGSMVDFRAQIKLMRVRARLLFFYGEKARGDRHKCTIGTSSLSKLLEIPEADLHTEILHLVKRMTGGDKATWRNGRLTLEFPVIASPVTTADVTAVFLQPDSRKGSLCLTSAELLTVWHAILSTILQRKTERKAAESGMT